MTVPRGVTPSPDLLEILESLEIVFREMNNEGEIVRVHRNLLNSFD